VEVIGLDHVYLSVADFERSERFYDAAMGCLGFRKGDKPIGGERHAHYFNRALQVTIRPAHGAAAHDPYAPGLHHLCLQLPSPRDVDAAHRALCEAGIDASPPKPWPEYHPEYYATFFRDPDGIRLELVCRTTHRERIVKRWHDLRVFTNPLAELDARERSTAAPERNGT